MTDLLTIRDLSISFRSGDGYTRGVQNVDITVRQGEIVALVGESGSGKSITSLSILRLLPSPPARYDSGAILFTDRQGRQQDLLKLDAAGLQKIRGNEIAMIFQEPMTSLNPVLTCGEQVVEAMLAHHPMRAAEARRKAIALFEKVKLPDPEGIFSRYPHQLSGGQKQRVMIAMAMSNRPSLLICDEPTTALDVTVQKTILELIKELQQTEQMGVIFITHDLGVVAEIADRAVVLYRGNIVEQGTTEELFRNPSHPYTRGLLNCRPVLHRKGERLPVVADFLNPTPPTASESSSVVTSQSSSPSPAASPGSQAPPAPQPPPSSSPASQAPPASQPPAPQRPPAPRPLIEVRDLQVWYPAKTNFLGKVLRYTKAVDGVSFDIFKGETLGLVGESGCGKTTLGRTLLRLVQPSAGSIRFEGREMSEYSANELKKLRSHIQIIFQDPYSSLNPRLTIGSAISEVLRVHGLAATAAQRRERVIDLLEKVSLLPEHFDRYPHEFSGGQRQRIVIARALALRPSFIVCDESVSALDVSVQAQVLNLLNDLKAEFGFTSVFISHDLSVVRYISDRILVMKQGRIEEIGEAEQVYRMPHSAYTRQLLEAIPQLDPTLK